jgi:hypothetical protein
MLISSCRERAPSREALLHAILGQNYGCTHLIVFLLDSGQGHLCVADVQRQGGHGCRSLGPALDARPGTGPCGSATKAWA